MPLPALFATTAALVFLAVPGSPGPVAFAQGLTDLLGKKTPEPAANAELPLKFGLDRVDLGLSPGLGAISSPQRTMVGFSAQADLRMICGQYDLKASLQHLLGREAREEFLEGMLHRLTQEIVGSGMELLCQAEPTLCTLLQNYSISANLKMGYYKDLCVAIESAVVDAQNKAYASTVDSCLKEKRDQGVPLDQAMDLCQKKTAPIRGFHGEVLGELDLGRELQGLFGQMGLSPGAQKIARQLSDQTKVGPFSVASEADAGALSRLYDETREDYAARLGGLLDQARSRQPIRPGDLRAAVPQGAPPLAEDEIRRLSLLSDPERSSVLSSLSSALAITEMGREMREVERAIEALQGAPTVDEAKRKLLDDRLARLRNEKARLIESLREQALVQDAIARADALAGREVARRVGEVQARAGQARMKSALVDELGRPGALPAGGSGKGLAAATSAGAACDTCGLGAVFGSYSE